MDSWGESDSDIEIPMGKNNVFTAVRNGTPPKYASKHTGSEETSALSYHLDALQDDQLDMLNDVSGWAHTVQISKRDHGSKSRTIPSTSIPCSRNIEHSNLGCNNMNVHIACEMDLEKPSKQNPRVASISGSHLKTKKPAAKVANNFAGIHLEDDERQILLDSGASLGAADIEVDVPAYLPLITARFDQQMAMPKKQLVEAS